MESTSGSEPESQDQIPLPSAAMQKSCRGKAKSTEKLPMEASSSRQKVVIAGSQSGQHSSGEPSGRQGGGSDNDSSLADSDTALVEEETSKGQHDLGKMANRSLIDEEQTDEEELGAAGNENLEAQEEELIMLHIINPEEYLQTATVFVLDGPDQENLENDSSQQRNFSLRRRAGQSGMQRSEAAKQKGPLAKTNTRSSSAHTSSHGTVPLSIEVRKGGSSKIVHYQPTTVPQRPGSSLAQPTCGVELSTAALNHHQQNQGSSHSAPRPEDQLPVIFLIIKKADIKKTVGGYLLSSKNQPSSTFGSGINYSDIYKNKVIVKNLRSLNSVLEYLMVISMDKAGRAFLKKISFCTHPFLQAFIQELIGEDEVWKSQVFVSCQMECLRASMAKYLLLHLNDPHTIVRNTSTEFEGTTLNLAPIVILNILTAASVTRRYIYSEARLNSQGQPEECTHGQILDTMDTAIPYALFKVALETGEIPHIPIKYPCSCGASASIKAILSMEGFFIRFFGRGLNLTRDNINQVLPPQAEIESMKFRLNVISAVFLPFNGTAQSLMLIPMDGDFDMIRNGTLESAGEFSFHALLANYVRDEE